MCAFEIDICLSVYYNSKVSSIYIRCDCECQGGAAMARILIVDDAKFMRITLTNILKKANHEIVGEGETGKDAVLLYRQLKPDLVTMDITMPEMSGIDAVKEIKKEFPQAKVIMCSAMGQQKMVVEAIEAGAKDFIVKPFDEGRVLEAINRVLS
jgi:two-component system, chemotaxis family, chemotaxis protein CheY